MADKYQPTEFRAQTARLITRTSNEKPGLADYTIKRDFRREADDDIRREGVDYFYPNTTGDFAASPLNQPFPNISTQFTLNIAGGDSITRSTVTAHAFVGVGHKFVEGETIKVSGANQAAYNGSFAIFNVTKTTFEYTMISDPGATATGTILIRSDMPITLVHMARRPNGDNAVIVGTKTTLFRFFSMDNGAYFEGTGSASYFEEPPAANSPYFNDNPGDWIIIGRGFSMNGHRWEAVNINGYAVFNNGVDLPMTYRVEEYEVVPIYELREQGVAAVGTIAEYAGCLHCMDISNIDPDLMLELFALGGDISGGDVLVSQTAFALSTVANFFTAAMVGRWIAFEDHSVAQITAVGSGIAATSSVSATKTNQTFTLLNKASQSGAVFSGLITASVAVPTGAAVVASSGIFAAPMVGSTIRFSNGFESVISGYTNNTNIAISPAATVAIVALPFWISDPAASYRVVATGEAFLSTDVGRKLLWANGQERTITTYVSATQVDVDSDSAIASDFFNLDNPDTYGAFTDENSIDRIQFRDMWSMIDQPRRWAAILPASIPQGTMDVTLGYHVKSLAVGDAITILGAGTDGSSLSATILAVTDMGGKLLIDTPAETTVLNQDSVLLSDAIGSIVGYQDIQDDGSGILRAMKLDNYLVVYKDTSIFLGRYTGDVLNPFAFENLNVPDGFTLYYRWTLCSVGEHVHVYAGANTFYELSMTARTPRPIMELELASNIFFDQAKLVNTDSIFAADSVVTNEIFFQFPVSSGSDLGVCFDYKYRTVSTTTIAVTAAASVKRPQTSLATGVTEDWFVMGTSTGVVLLYGKTDEANPAWGAGVKQIFYRRSASPYSATKSSYTSILQSGMEAFGDEYNEKDLRAFVPIIGSKSPNCTILSALLGSANPVDAPSQLALYTFTDMVAKNLLPVFFRRNYFGQSLTITGIDNPCRINAWIYDAALVRSHSHVRRP